MREEIYNTSYLHNDEPDPKTSVLDSDVIQSSKTFAYQETDPRHQEDSILTRDRNWSLISRKRDLDCTIEAEEHGTQDKRRCYDLDILP